MAYPSDGLLDEKLLAVLETSTQAKFDTLNLPDHPCPFGYLLSQPAYDSFSQLHFLERSGCRSSYHALFINYRRPVITSRDPTTALTPVLIASHCVGTNTGFLGRCCLSFEREAEDNMDA
jgi:hypothetical protein